MNHTKANILFIACVIFTSCYTEKKALEQVNKANDKFPKVVAELARDKYPCTDLLKPDTTTILRDSLIYVDCPDTSANRNDYTFVRVDTFNRVVTNTKTIKVPVHIPIVREVITNYYEDSAKIKLYDLALNKATTENTKLKETVSKQDKKIANKNKENWIWRIIALALLAWQGIRLWKNITTIKVKHT